jgi:hypothetical protein
MPHPSLTRLKVYHEHPGGLFGQRIFVYQLRFSGFERRNGQMVARYWCPKCGGHKYYWYKRGKPRRFYVNRRRRWR